MEVGSGRRGPSRLDARPAGGLGPGEGQEGAWAEERTGPFPEQVCILTIPNPPNTPATLW